MATGSTANRVVAPGAVVVAAEEEIRILLRGLLQLHRVRVDAEAAGLPEAIRLVRELRPKLVVADSLLKGGTSSELIVNARAIVPGLRFILVTPASGPPPEFGLGSGPDVVLARPFRIQQFAEALAPPPARSAEGP